MSCRLRGAGAVGQATDAARAFGTSLLLAPDDLARLCIVIEELVANLYDHGGVTEEDVVELTLERDPNGIHVAIADPGTSFNPWAAPPAIERPGPGAGAGVSLVRAWAEFVSYRTSAEGNLLELVLPVRRQG